MSTGKVWGSVGAAALAILGAVFALEGGYADNPADPGGKTNLGITEQVARQHGYQDDMRELSKGFAERIYAQDYIERPNFHRVIALSPAVGEELVDAGVNAGPGRQNLCQPAQHRRWRGAPARPGNRRSAPAVVFCLRAGPGGRLAGHASQPWRIA